MLYLIKRLLTPRVFRKITALLLIASLCSVFVGCSAEKTEPDVKDDKNDSGTVIIEDKNEEEIIDTEFYTVTVPEEWKDICEYETVKDGGSDSLLYSLNFYEKESREKGFGGFVFSVALMDINEAIEYPSFDYLGKLHVNSADKDLHVAVLYPSDVQFDESTAKNYNTMNDSVSALLSTIEYKTSCRFTKCDYKAPGEDDISNIGDVDNSSDGKQDGTTISFDTASLAGDWNDTWSQRAYLNIECSGDDVSVMIFWANSAFETMVWKFSGTWDKSISGMEYTNCELLQQTADSSGNTSETTVYSDGGGMITLKDGQLLWDDYVGHAGESCAFEKAE